MSTSKGMSERERISADCATVNDEPSKTIQGAAFDADINNIAKSFGLTPFGKMPLPAEATDPRYYGDMSEAADMDLQTAMNRVFEAQDHFDRLPATVRARFDHNPAELWNFLQDASNVPEAIKLGILLQHPAEAISGVVPPVSPPIDKPPA